MPATYRPLKSLSGSATRTSHPMHEHIHLFTKHLQAIGAYDDTVVRRLLAEMTEIAGDLIRDVERLIR